MQYDLDPQMLPPGGVSVQCTRCRHVFTASPSGVQAPPAPRPAAPTPAPAPAPAPGKLNSTVIYGAGSKPAAPAVPPVAPVSPVAPRPATAQPSPSTTQTFGALPPEFFPRGMTPTAATPSVRTFKDAGGPGDSEDRTLPYGKPRPSGERPAPKAAPPEDPSRTQRFGAGELADVIARAQAASAPPSQAVSAPPPPVQLPPEPPAPPPQPLPMAPPPAAPRRTAPVGPPPELLSGRPRSAAATPAPPTQRTDGLLWSVVGLVGVLLLAAPVLWLLLRERKEALPAQAVASREEAVALLRRDDGTSRERALSMLRELATQHPGYIEARADLALALALEVDDARVERERLEMAEQRRVRHIRALVDEKSSSDWEIRVNALKADIEALRKARQPVDVRLQEFTRQALDAQVPLSQVPPEEPPEATAARVRAQAVFSGVTAAQDALVFAERLGTLEAASPWAVVARAEYALNAGSPPRTLEQTASALEALREQDRTFLRAYVLGARTAMRQGDTAGAQALLDAVVAFNPHHGLARRLQEWLVEDAREAGASP